MNRKTLIPAGVAASIVVLLGVLIAFGLFPKVTAQEGVVEFLEERFKELNIPVTEITILTESPLQIEITIQSQSDGEEWMPEDFIYFHLVRREIILANEGGYDIDGYTEIFVNTTGAVISWASIKAEERTISYVPSPTAFADDLTMNLVNENLNTYGMLIVDKEVSSLDGFQTLRLDLSTASLKEANEVIPQFIDSLRPFAMDINTQGGRVIMIRAEIKDENGNMLLDYLLDLQLDMETWWKADGVTDSRFSHPGPPTPRPEDLFTPTPPSTATATPTS